MFCNVAIGAMAVLAVIAAFWIGFAITRRKTKDKTTLYFWRMNLYWNIVNLLVAAGGFAVINGQKGQLAVEKQAQYISVIGWCILINLLLLVAGAVLLRLAANPKKDFVRFGYGQSIVVQALFLLVFDIALVIALDTVR